MDRGLELGSFISNPVLILLSCMTLARSGLSLNLSSLAEQCRGANWCSPKYLLFEHTDPEFLQAVSCAVFIYSFVIIRRLQELIVNKSGCIEPQLWEGLAEECRLISCLLSRLQCSLFPFLAPLSLSLSFSCLPALSCSRLLLSPSRLLIGNHHIVSVTMSSVAAKAVIIPATQSKWLGENGIFQVRCKTF